VVAPSTGSTRNSTRRKPSSPLAGTIFISLAAYGVLGYALSTNPPDVLPPLVSRALAVFPHLIAAVNATALICLLAGWRAIRAGSVVAHRRLMLASVMLISAFLILYVARVALGGTKPRVGAPRVPTAQYRILSSRLRPTVASSAVTPDHTNQQDA
jgi:uncharacterized membrane protein YozB (DUF420 family)